MTVTVPARLTLAPTNTAQGLRACFVIHTDVERMRLPLDVAAELRSEVDTPVGTLLSTSPLDGGGETENDDERTRPKNGRRMDSMGREGTREGPKRRRNCRGKTKLSVSSRVVFLFPFPLCLLPLLYLPWLGAQACAANPRNGF